MASSITRTRVDLKADGGVLPLHLFLPPGPGPHPAVALGIEAMGINRFNISVAERLAAQGYAVAMPDYFREQGPKEPDNYDDFTDVMAKIDALDFRRGTHDLLAAVDYLRLHRAVDPARVVVWGYCTGGTFAMFAAGLDRALAGAVIFFPSQIVFEELTPKRPMQVMDILWNIACPLLLIAGAQDPVVPAERVAELRRRCTQWGIDHTIRIYEGAGHAFSSPSRTMYNEKADKESWAEALAFLKKCVG